jgi:hypothetical protein
MCNIIFFFPVNQTSYSQCSSSFSIPSSQFLCSNWPPSLSLFRFRTILYSLPSAGRHHTPLFRLSVLSYISLYNTLVLLAYSSQHIIPNRPVFSKSKSISHLSLSHRCTCSEGTPIYLLLYKPLLFAVYIYT